MCECICVCLSVCAKSLDDSYVKCLKNVTKKTSGNLKRGEKNMQMYIHVHKIFYPETSATPLQVNELGMCDTIFQCPELNTQVSKLV